VNLKWVSDIVEAAEEHDLGLLMSDKQQRPENVSSSSDEQDTEDVVD
jgi:predicted fused transcriptional regulator/phosphomethylpyrimidine kinase